MAQRVEVLLIDDLNGQDAQETVRFATDGSEYEIDLTMENAAQLRSALSKYVERARKVDGSRGNRSGHAALSSARQRENLQQIRNWARENGYNPSSRGRISRTIRNAYDEAQQRRPDKPR